MLMTEDSNIKRPKEVIYMDEEFESPKVNDPSDKLPIGIFHMERTTLHNALVVDQ